MKSARSMAAPMIGALGAASDARVNNGSLSAMAKVSLQ